MTDTVSGAVALGDVELVVFEELAAHMPGVIDLFLFEMKKESLKVVAVGIDGGWRVVFHL
jgi:hypothetical protein